MGIKIRAIRIVGVVFLIGGGQIISKNSLCITPLDFAYKGCHNVGNLNIKLNVHQVYSILFFKTDWG